MAKSGIYNPTQHDIGIPIVGSDGTSTNVIGMILAQREMRLNSKTPPYLVPFYQEFDDEYLASQFFSDPAGYGNLPPEKEIAIRQDDWRAGFGEDIFDSSDPRRYFSSSRATPSPSGNSPGTSSTSSVTAGATLLRLLTNSSGVTPISTGSMSRWTRYGIPLITDG